MQEKQRGCCIGGGHCYRINQVTLSLVTTLGTRARPRDVAGPSATNRSAVTASVRSALELQTKVREDFTITEKAPT